MASVSSINHCPHSLPPLLSFDSPPYHFLPLTALTNHVSPPATTSISKPAISTQWNRFWSSPGRPSSSTKQRPDHSVRSHSRSMHRRCQRSADLSPGPRREPMLTMSSAGNLKSLNDLAKTAKADYILHTGDFGFYDHTSLERIAEKSGSFLSPSSVP